MDNAQARQADAQEGQQKPPSALNIDFVLEVLTPELKQWAKQSAHDLRDTPMAAFFNPDDCFTLALKAAHNTIKPKTFSQLLDQSVLSQTKLLKEIRKRYEQELKREQRNFEGKERDLDVDQVQSLSVLDPDILDPRIKLPGDFMPDQVDLELVFKEVARATQQRGGAAREKGLLYLHENARRLMEGDDEISAEQWLNQQGLHKYKNKNTQYYASSALKKLRNEIMLAIKEEITWDEFGQRALMRQKAFKARNGQIPLAILGDNPGSLLKNLRLSPNAEKDYDDGYVIKYDKTYHRMAVIILQKTTIKCTDDNQVLPYAGRLLFEFYRLCRQKDITIDLIADQPLTGQILVNLLEQLDTNCRALKIKPEKLVYLTIHRGAIGPYLSESTKELMKKAVTHPVLHKPILRRYGLIAHYQPA